MNMHKARTQLAYALIRLACRISDTPLRSIYVANKRTVGDKLLEFTADTEPPVKLSRRKLRNIRTAYIQQQSALRRLFNPKDTDTDE